MGLFPIESEELFASMGFEPRPSWSLSPEQLGLQAWTKGTSVIHDLKVTLNFDVFDFSGSDLSNSPYNYL
jgi:hypothetical protein